MTSESFSKIFLKSKVPIGIPSGRFARTNPKNRRDFSVVSWEKYYEKCEDLKIDGDLFRIYQSGSTGPVCFFLHGGGFSALSWAVLSKHLSELVTCRCVALDQRGHGDTHTTDDIDLSADVLARDVGRVIEALYGSDLPPIVLIGHSMGGAIAVHSSFKSTVPYLVGLVVIDVVEGTALDALSSMQGFLRSRPSVFTSVEAAIEYCCKSGQIRNMESAKVSVVGQLKRLDTDETATSEASHGRPSKGDDVIKEEDEDDDDVNKKNDVKVASRSEENAGPTPGKYGWRIDLTSTEPYWNGWFEGLSQMFLSCTPPKMLLLAGVDRLDRDLTIGQMQGKFQLELMPQCGHVVHEDCPEKVAERLAGFLIRYKLAESTSGSTRTFLY